jgi:type I restriction enzyme S subunit
MKTAALGKVARIDRTVANDDECLTLPYVGLEHVEKESGRFADGFVPTPLNMLATNFRFTPKHVLYGKLRPYLNKVVLPNFDGVCTTEILPILPNEEKLDRTFLWAILLSPTFVNWATSQISGANLPRLDPKLLAEYEIPLPPLTEQKRIASLLRHADRLRQLRRTAHDLGDSLLQSVFLEMFGDPKINPKKWDMCIIDDVVEFSQYGTSDKSNSEKRGYPILGMANITYEGRLDLERLSYVDLSEKEFAQLKLERGDVIFNRTNSTELVGKTTYWSQDFDAVIASYLVKLRLKKEMLSEFFVALMNMPHYKSMFQERCKKAVGQSNISPTLLKEFPIFVPPLSKQEEFASVVRRVESLRGRMAESERQVEGLFESLLSQSFGGG